MVSDVAQLERDNNKCYVSIFRCIYIYIYIYNIDQIDNCQNVGTKITITPNVGNQTDIFAYL